eukprot:TRINITY_DN1926_c0_g1_i1.p1 TRINITY_DN1926_c0_g1~~TRINITY_DN1926_c0_g1_i1.p1  ORF type:complete len:336 (+),score=22.94 TRINITY_DN1926_c0_g1_i1:45-1010(+)
MSDRPPEKCNPRIVYLDLERSGGRELRRGMEQLTRALVGRLDACEKMQLRMAEAARKHNGSTGSEQVFSEPNHHQPVLRREGSFGTVDPAFTGPRGGLRKILLIDALAEDRSQHHNAFLNFLESRGNRPETRALVGRQATHAAFLQSLQWLSSSIHEEDSIMFCFIGRGTAEGLWAYDSEKRGVVSRISFMELFDMIPRGAHLTMVIDTGDAGTPLELPYSVVAHHTPGGFEMTTGDLPQNATPSMMLLSTFCNQPTPYNNTCGALTSSILAVLQSTPHPSFRTLISSLRDDLETTLGFDSPMPLLSSSRPFHPDAVVQIG